MARTYTYRKYDGDCPNSWAVFDKADLKGLPRGIIFYGMATPVMTGMSQSEAKATAERLTKRESMEG